MRRTERGWGGHFICSHRCLFRRNTLLESGDRRIVISTVGGMKTSEDRAIETIGASGRYYETMAFEATKDGPYWEADVEKQLSFDSEWAICSETVDMLPNDVDNIANAMHEAVVDEFAKEMV